MENPWEVALAVDDGDWSPSPRLKTFVRFRRTRTDQLLRRAELPPITIVEVAEDTNVEDLKQVARQLSAKLSADSTARARGRFIIFALEGNPRKLPEWDVELFRSFSNPECVDIARKREVESRIEGLVAKLRARDSDAEDSPARGSVQPRQSPLDHVAEVVAATKDLREKSGKLSADRVAKAFGVPKSQLARWLGRSRQAIGKAPDAESLQAPLGYFERIARLRSALGDQGDFRRWLHLPDRQLDGKRPIDVIEQGRMQVVADLVDDMLTGSPG